MTKQQLESGIEIKKVLRNRAIESANIAYTAMHSSHEINDVAFYNGRRDAYRRIASSIDYISEKSHLAKPFVGKLIHHLQGVREQTVAVFFDGNALRPSGCVRRDVGNPRPNIQKPLVA